MPAGGKKWDSKQDGVPDNYFLARNPTKLKEALEGIFDSAAEGLDDLAGSIESRSFNELYEDAEAFARRSPVAVAVATFAAGLLLARFVKASGERQTDADYGRGRGEGRRVRRPPPPATPTT